MDLSFSYFHPIVKDDINKHTYKTYLNPHIRISLTAITEKVF